MATGADGLDDAVHDLQRRLWLGTAATAADAVRHEVAHELANVLHSLRFNALLARDHVAATASAVDDRERMADEVETAGQCIGDLLGALEQLESVVARLGWRDAAPGAAASGCDAAGTVELAVRVLRSEVERVARLTLFVDASATADIDSVLLAHVVVQLVTHASQAIAPGAPDDHEISVRVGLDREWAVVSVSSSGTGVAPRAGGPSVGLTIARDIVTQARGKLITENGAEGGARWSVRLPIVAAQQ